MGGLILNANVITGNATEPPPSLVRPTCKKIQTFDIHKFIMNKLDMNEHMDQGLGTDETFSKCIKKSNFFTCNERSKNCHDRNSIIIIECEQMKLVEFNEVCPPK